MLPFLLLIALAGIQLGLVAYCGTQAGTAARTAARTAAESGNRGGDAAGRSAGQSAVSDWLQRRHRHRLRDSAEKVTAPRHASASRPSCPVCTCSAPSTRSATMPKEDWTP